MKKLTIVFLVLALINSSVTFSSSHPMYNFSFDSSNIIPIAPSDWVTKYYSKLTDEEEKNDFKAFFLGWSLESKKALIEIHELCNQFAANPELFSQISKQGLKGIKFDYDFKGLQSWAGSWALCTLMGLFLRPDETPDKYPIDNFNEELVDRIEFLIFQIKQTDECLRLMHIIDMQNVSE